MDKNGLSAFLLGLGVGVGIGMLFAPKSGQETRDMIKNKANDSADYFGNSEGRNFARPRTTGWTRARKRWASRRIT